MSHSWFISRWVSCLFNSHWSTAWEWSFLACHAWMSSKANIYLPCPCQSLKQLKDTVTDLKRSSWGANVSMVLLDASDSLIFGDSFKNSQLASFWINAKISASNLCHGLEWALKVQNNISTMDLHRSSRGIEAEACSSHWERYLLSSALRSCAISWVAASSCHLLACTCWTDDQMDLNVEKAGTR